MRQLLPRNQEVRQRYDDKLARMDDMSEEEMSNLFRNSIILAKLGMTIDQVEEGTSRSLHRKASKPVYI